jgi:MFS family permease
VIGWIGMALFAAYGVGAAAGAAVYGRFGFVGVAAVTVVVPLLALAVTLRIPGVPSTHMQRPAFYKVVGLVKLPGLALTLSSFGYAAVNAFIALLWLQRGWGSAAIAFMAMAIGFLASRLTLGHLPDKLGGAKIAGICVAAEALGQLLIWATTSESIACLGAALTGAGYSLAFQGFGVEAVNRAPPQSRGSAMGGYVVFQDLSMALAGPFGGWLALQAGLDAVYLAGSLTAIASVGLAWWMVKTGARGETR